MFPIFFLLKVIIFVAFWVTVTVIVSILLKLIADHYRQTGLRRQHQWTQFFRWLVVFPVMFPVLSAPVIWIYATKVEPNWLEVTKVTIRDQKINPGLKDIKIIQITDLHIERVGFREKRLISIINRLDPDIILLNGDFINSREGWEPCLAVLKELRAKHGIYTILGDTDYYFGNETEIIGWLNAIGINVLKYGNLKADFGSKGSFWLVGLSDRYAELTLQGEKKYIIEAFNNVPHDDPIILLIPSPDQFKVAAMLGYKPQLVLVGDTHGGQVGIPALRQFSDYANRSKYMAGMFILNDIPLYVNRGIGMKTLYLRFFCRPEITMIQLRND